MLPTIRDDELSYLETVLQRMPSEGANRLRDRLAVNDEGNRWGAWGEVVIYDWLESTGKRPQFEPESDGKTPDFVVETKGQAVFIEVFVTLRSRDDAEIDTTPIRDGWNVAVWWPAATTTYHAASGRIIEKLDKYKGLGSPYVVCDVLKTPLISPADVRLLFQSWLLEHHSHVSGLSVVEPRWEPSAGRYRLECRIFPNPKALHLIDSTTFEDCIYLRTLSS